MILQTASLADLTAEAVQVTLRVGQSTPQLLADLARFGDGVEMGGNGRIHLTLPHENKIPELAHWLISHDYTLYELSPQRLSLEDRFLQIIGEGVMG